jgi:uncharacterized protein (DUF433 family)
MNLLEGFVLTALRRQRFVPMKDIRQALDRILTQDPGVKYPLATRNFATIGKRLFLQEAGTDVTPAGQTALGEYLEVYLKRIEHAADGWGYKLYPFPRYFMGDPSAPRAVSMSPTLAYGRPVLDNTRIPTAIIKQRVITGETPEQIAEDYDRDASEILEVIRWELASAA